MGRSVLPGRRERRAVKRSLMTYRAFTAGQRRLPDFLVLGAQKAGTSALYSYLVEHPDVVAARRKEVEYFSVNYEKGDRWYRSYFPVDAKVRTLSAVRRRPVVTGEASPYYLFHPLAPARARRLLPDAKLVVLLRNPVERTFSQYRFEVQHGREELPFEAALDAEPARLAAESEQLRLGKRSRAHRYHSYVARSLYAEQLERWFANYPRDQFLVLRSEDLFAQPASVYATVTAFLGLEVAAPPAFRVVNEGRPSSLDPGTRQALESRFAEANRRLADLLGDDLGWAA